MRPSDISNIKKTQTTQPSPPLLTRLLVRQDASKSQHRLRLLGLMYRPLADVLLGLPEPLLDVFALGEDVGMRPVGLENWAERGWVSVTCVVIPRRKRGRVIFSSRCPCGL